MALLLSACLPERIPMPVGERPIPTRGSAGLMSPNTEIGTIAEEDSVWIRDRLTDLLQAFYSYPFRGGVELSTGLDCRADRGEFCLRGDWDTTPCFNSGNRPYCTTDEEEEADRAIVLATLDSAAAALPGDFWVLGQQVYHRLKFRRPGLATVMVQRCQVERWRCLALEGWVFHQSELYAEADSVFREMLPLLPEEQRCDWTDLDPVFRTGLPDSYQALGCSEREPINEVFWWLSDPLYFTPGNERWTEQMSRWVTLSLQDEVRYLRGQGLRNRDHYEYVLAYGFEDSWNVEGVGIPPSMRGAGSSGDIEERLGIPIFGRSSIITEVASDFRDPQPPVQTNAPSSLLRRKVVYSSARWKFSLEWEAVDDPVHASSESWEVDDPSLSKREGYTPPRGPVFVDLDPQVGFLLRGDSMEIVASVETGHLDRLPDGSHGTGVFASRGREFDALRIFDPTSRDEYRFRMAAPFGSYLLSVETIVQRGGAARARFGHAPPFSLDQPIALSDLFVFRPGRNEPATLEEAIPNLYGRTAYRTDEPLAFFWEMYGVERDEAVDFVLTVRREDGGFLGIGGGEETRVQWTENASPDTDGIWVNAQFVDLGVGDPGRYVVELRASAGGLPPVLVERAFELYAPEAGVDAPR